MSVKYNITNHESNTTHRGSLIDGGANGGLSGSDVRVIEQSTFSKTDVTGIEDQVVSDLPLSTVAGYVDTVQGPIIAIFHQYAHYGKGHTIHSTNQLKHFKLLVDDTPRSLGGKQRIITPDGYIISLSNCQGLAHMDMCPPTNHELDQYPHVMFTSDLPWNPTCLDGEAVIDDPSETDAIPVSYIPDDTRVNVYGEILLDDHDATVDHAIITVKANAAKLTNKAPDYNVLRPYFGWTPIDRIKKTLLATTQFARATMQLPFRKHFKTRFPAANVNRLNEIVATDTFFSDTPAADDGINGHGGANMVQIYCGKTSQLTRAF